MYILLYIFWIILNGKITVEILLVGLVLMLLIHWLMKKFFGYSVKKDLRITRKLPVAVTYAFVLLWEILKANLAVMKYILTDKEEELTPVLVSFPSHVKTEFGRFLLANSITLTPGTITVRSEEDELTVHCLMPALLDTSEDSVFVRWIRRLEAEK